MSPNGNTRSLWGVFYNRKGGKENYEKENQCHFDELNEKLIEKDILISVLVKEIRQLNEKTNG